MFTWSLVSCILLTLIILNSYIDNRLCFVLYLIDVI